MRGFGTPAGARNPSPSQTLAQNEDFPIADVPGQLSNLAGERRATNFIEVDKMSDIVN